MPTERSLGVKDGEEQTSTGNHPPDNNAPDSANDVDTTEVESDIDAALQNGGEETLDDLEAEDGDEETVVLPKKNLEKILKDRNNYRSGLLSSKDKIKGLKKGKPAAASEQEREATGTQSQSADATLAKANERSVIDALTKPTLPNGDENPEYDPDIDENWAEIIPFYTPRHGRQTANSIKEDLYDAKLLYQKRHPKKQGSETREIESDISSESGAPTGKSEGGKPTERKHVLPRTSSAQGWFPTKKK